MQSVEDLDRRFPPTHPIWDQQYSRFATYVAHLDFLGSAKPQTWESVAEFGGSNRFLSETVLKPQISVMPNYPEVDVQDLSQYSSGSFEAVLLDEVLEHVRDPCLALAEVHRVLRPGGCLIMSTPFMIAEHRVPEDYWRFTEAALRVLLGEFQTVQIGYWGNVGSVRYLLDDMMVSARQARRDGVFDLSVAKKYAVSLWAYAWK